MIRQGRHVNRVCVLCGKEFSTRERRPAMHCSRLCYFKNRVGQKRGLYTYKGKRPSEYLGKDISERKVNDKGYMTIKVNSKNYKHHRYVVEQMLGRKLNKDEVVHHINGIRNDNRIENLRLMTKKEHDSLHKKIGV